MPKGCGFDCSNAVGQAGGPGLPASVEPGPPLPPSMYVELRRENESKTSAPVGAAAGVGEGAGVWPGLPGLEKLGAVGSVTNCGLGHVKHASSCPLTQPRTAPLCGMPSLPFERSAT